MTEKKTVKNQSEGNRYNYASLADIANQGYEIPKMKTERVEGREYVFYYDETTTEWLQGAMVVVPSPILNKEGRSTMNEAQLYGSALTYARRYTTLMALQLACEDDKALESAPIKASDKQVLYIEKLYKKEEIGPLCAEYKVEALVDLTATQASEIIKKRYGQK